MNRYRPLIFIGPPNRPEECIGLVVGTWAWSLRKAKGSGLAVYFDTYASRYGFKHPEDPRRTAADGPLPATVIAFREGDHLISTKTFDPDAEVANVAV